MAMEPMVGMTTYMEQQQNTEGRKNTLREEGKAQCFQEASGQVPGKIQEGPHAYNSRCKVRLTTVVSPRLP